MYTDDIRYSGRGDVFVQKWKIWTSKCEQAGIKKDSLRAAFPTMLKGEAQQFWLSNQPLFFNIPIEDIPAAFRTRYEGPEYQVNLHTEWNSITLQAYINENKSKPIIDCFDTMMDRLRMLALGQMKVQIQTI